MASLKTSGHLQTRPQIHHRKSHSRSCRLCRSTHGGGADKGPTPLEYLFVALAGCIGSIGRIVATQRKLNVRGMEITVEGELDVARC